MTVLEKILKAEIPVSIVKYEVTSKIGDHLWCNYEIMINRKDIPPKLETKFNKVTNSDKYYMYAFRVMTTEEYLFFIQKRSLFKVTLEDKDSKIYELKSQESVLIDDRVRRELISKDFFN